MSPSKANLAAKSKDISTEPDVIIGLAALEKAIARDLEILDYPCRNWHSPRQTSDGKKIYDVLIIGGGQGGLACAFALMREKISNILVLDENPEGLEGPWLTFARMNTLRTPKYLTGPDLGIPNLTPRAWYEAQFGAKAWQDLILLPKEQWAQYLRWYRSTLNIPVQNNSRAGAIQWQEAQQCFSIPVEKLEEISVSPQAQRDEIEAIAGTFSKRKALSVQAVYARKVILATGIDGSGRWDTPEFISANLAGSLWAHTRDYIDFEKLKGKKIGILGAGASSFDNASIALEKGASEVHLFFRRKQLPNINPYRWAEFVGFLKHHGDLPDSLRWKFIEKIILMGQLPPGDTLSRATKHSNFYMHGGSSWTAVREQNNQVIVSTPNGEYDFDFVIVGTGCVTDLSLRPELRLICEKIALWKDKYTPASENASIDLQRHPYLGKNFEFMEKNPGDAAYLSSIFNFTFGCLLSLGFGGASISGMKYGIQRITNGITRQLYMEDSLAHYKSLEEFDLREF